MFLKAQQTDGQANAASIVLSMLCCLSDPRSGTLLRSGALGLSRDTYDAGIVCPSNNLGVAGSRESAAWCHYLWITNGNGKLFTSNRVRIADISSDTPDIQRRFCSWQSGGNHSVQADGAVRFLSVSMECNTITGLSTRSDSEVIGEFWNDPELPQICDSSGLFRQQILIAFA